jgi:hypothetical protein
MKFYFFLIFGTLTLAHAYAYSSKIDFSYYHTTSQIDSIMKGLIQNCHKLQISEHSAADYIQDPSLKENFQLLKYYDIKEKEENLKSNLKISLRNNLKSNLKSNLKINKKKQNVFLLAGEHPRELISSEFLLHFIVSMCENETSNFVQDFNFRVIINANPNGRKIVEKGEYCRRTNLNNVDLNRNWDIFWSRDTSNTSEEYPGWKPFSELESRFISDSIRNFDAKLFLTLHSGVYGLFLPYAYLEKEGKLV